MYLTVVSFLGYIYNYCFRIFGAVRADFDAANNVKKQGLTLFRMGVGTKTPSVNFSVLTFTNVRARPQNVLTFSTIL